MGDGLAGAAACGACGRRSVATGAVRRRPIADGREGRAGVGAGGGGAGPARFGGHAAPVPFRGACASPALPRVERLAPSSRGGALALARHASPPHVRHPPGIRPPGRLPPSAVLAAANRAPGLGPRHRSRPMVDGPAGPARVAVLCAGRRVQAGVARVAPVAPPGAAPVIAPAGGHRQAEPPAARVARNQRVLRRGAGPIRRALLEAGAA
mmetsp:Transcript_26372/g.85179  ORF Transcript_26372/g.85179 Transcript_26372/m.85179 type:complete len:210 (-) Transcript_26372:217-846(-)